MAGFEFDSGSTVSHFRLEKKLGEGGMGAVFLAEDLTLSRRVAIKFMSRALLAQRSEPGLRENLEQRFVREARSAAAINHPNVCQIYEANFDSDDWFIAMEFIQGQSLMDMIEAGHEFAETEVADLLRQCCIGLKYAWEEHKIIHRDIKPHNLMVARGGIVKIVDMGLAKPVHGGDEEDAGDAMPALTMAGVPLGTPHYMAPEQAGGEPDVDYRADIFALGASFYEVITGFKAFEGKTAPMIYMAQMGKKYVPIRERRPDVATPLVKLVDRMLEPQRSQRIGTYEEILGALEAIAPGPAAVSVSAPPPAHPARQGIPEFYQPGEMLLGRYEVKELVGKSRAGVVYVCRDRELDQDVAVKSLAPGREFPVSAMGHIAANIKAIMPVEDPTLVRIRDLRTGDGGELFVVMELMQGRNLRAYTHQLYESGTATVLGFLPVICRLATAVDHCHACLAMAHADLKPESVFLLDGDAVRLIDYHLCSLTPTEATAQGKRPELSEPLASPYYMAPEVFAGGVATPRSDQYSLAVVVYEMIARRLPFWTEQDLEQVKNATLLGDRTRFVELKAQVLEQPAPPIDGIPTPINEVLTKALAKDPGDRYPNCSAFAVALERAVRGGVGLKIFGIAAAVAVLGLVALLVLSIVAWAPWRRSQSGLGGPATPPAGQLANQGTTLADTFAAAQRAQLKAHAADLQTSFAKALDPIAALPDAAQRLAPLADLRAQLDAAVAAEDWAAAVPLFEEGIAKLELMRTAVDNARAAAQQAAEDAARAAIATRRQAVADALAALPDHADRAVAVAAGETLLAKADAATADKDFETARATLDVAATEVAKAAAAITTKIAVEQQQEAQRQREDAARREAAAQEAERLQRRLAAQADELARAVANRLAELREQTKDAAVFQPAEALVAKARTQIDAKQPAEAVASYQGAMDALAEADVTIRRQLRTRAETARTAAMDAFDQVRRYKDLDPRIAARFAAHDVAMAMGRQALEAERYADAEAQFAQAGEIAAKVATMVRTEFTPMPGRNFAVPRANLELVWVQPLGFWAGKYEITNDQFRRFKPAHDSKRTEEGLPLNKPDQPACHVSYFDALGYCTWLNAQARSLPDWPAGTEFRVPTREEWQALARCGDERLYPWGSDWPPTYGNFGNQEVFPTTWDLKPYRDNWPATCDVADSGCNEWDICGLAGNVWEWTSDEQNGRYGVFGGAWTEVNRATLAINVKGFNYAPPNDAYDNIGFRVILVPAKP